MESYNFNIYKQYNFKVILHIHYIVLNLIYQILNLLFHLFMKYLQYLRNLYQ